MLSQKRRIGCGLQRLRCPYHSSGCGDLLSVCCLARLVCRVVCGLGLIGDVLGQLILFTGVDIEGYSRGS